MRKSNIRDKTKLIQRDKAFGRTTMERIAIKEQGILDQKDQKYYVQKVDDPSYLNDTIGPGKTKPYKEQKGSNGQKWRKILLFEFMGCTYR